MENGDRRSGLGRAALVTGASRGIGAAIARRLAAEGFGVVVNLHTEHGVAQRVVDETLQQGGRAVTAQADVADAGQVKGLFVVAAAQFGRLDVVVSNAGVGRSVPIAQASDADFDEVFATNTRGTFNALREAALWLSDGGRIVVISRAGLRPGAGGGLYAASKAAGDALVSAAAQELGRRQITVNSILPGATRTDMWTGRDRRVGDDSGVTARTALGRLGEPEDIADVVAFLVSDQARWITGATIAADGGLT